MARSPCASSPTVTRAGGKAYKKMRAAIIVLVMALVAFAAGEPPAEMLQVETARPEPGPRITPFLRYQLDRAWEQDEARRTAFAAGRTAAGLGAAQAAPRAERLAH